MEQNVQREANGPTRVVSHSLAVEAGEVWDCGARGFVSWGDSNVCENFAA